MHYVVIGNGIAGITAANELRRRDEEALITVVSKEWDHFFSRTALMYEFCGQLSRKDLEPYDRDHYSRMNFERISDRVVSVDPVTKKLTFAEHPDINYHKLLIACGSQPSKAAWQKDGIDGVGHFVTLDNLEWLKQESKRCKKHRCRAAVVGGGLIGVEVAEILIDAGIETHFIIREEWYWPIALNKRESNLVIDHMRLHGCHVHLETEVSEVLDDGQRLSGLKLTNGKELDVDLLVVAIGVTPATEWLEGSGIRLSTDQRHRGIVVNELLETNQRDVYAAGDCASVTWFDGRKAPEQLWYTGREQGAVAASNMLGAKTPYKRGTLYNSAKFFDIEYTTAGLVNFPIPELSEWYQEDRKRSRSQRIIVDQGLVIGFNMLGSRWDQRLLIEWIEQRRTLEWVLENLGKAAFDAEFASSFEVKVGAQTYTV